MTKEDDWWPSGRAALLMALALATGTAVVQRSSAPQGPAASPRSNAAPVRTAVVHKLPESLAASQPILELLADALGANLDEYKAHDAATALRDYLNLKLLRAPDAADARAVVALDI